MIRSILPAFLLSLTLFACKKNGDKTGGGEPPVFTNVQKNTTVITTDDGLVVKVDPATGASEQVFDFGRYNDATGFDYHNGVIYMGDESLTVNAIDLNARSLKWRVPFIKEKSTTASWVDVIVKDGVCYAAGYEGVIVAIDVANKKAIWAKAADPNFDIDRSNRFPGDLSVVGDKVIFASNHTTFYGDNDRNYVYVFERSTGNVLQKLTMPKETYATGNVAVSGNTLIIPMKDLLAVDLTTGEEKWRLSLKGLYGAGTPVIVGDKILVHGSAEQGVTGKFYCLSLSNGSKLWEIDGGMDMVGRYKPTVIEGKYVLGFYERGTSLNANGRPFLVRIDNGSKIWENNDISIHKSATYANGKFFVFGMELDGKSKTGSGLMCIDAATGKLDWINESLKGPAHSQPLVIAENGIWRGPQF